MFPAYGFGSGLFGDRAQSERDTGRLDAAASLLRDIHDHLQLLFDEPAALGVGAVVEEARARADAGREVERGLVLVATTCALVPCASGCTG